MSKRPKRYPRLATNAAPGMVIEPASDYIESGMPVASRIPAQWYNYHQNLNGQWVDYLRGPSYSNWTRRDLASDIVSGGVAFLATDRESADDGVYSRAALVGVDVTGAMRVYVSHRGHEWDEVSRFVDNTVNAPKGLKKLGPLWTLWTSTNLLTTPADNADGLSALTVGGSVLWTDVGIDDVADVAYDADHGNRWLAIQATLGLGLGWKKSADGALWATMGATGSPTGTGLAIAWSGAEFVSVTSTGQVWTTADPNVGGSLSATLAASSAWRLCAGEGVVFAYQRNVASPVGYRSADHGTTWLSVAFPASLGFIQSVTYLEGQWLLTSSQYPYLWSSADLVVWDAEYVPIPQNPTGFKLVGAAGTLRSVLLLGPEGGFVLQSTVAHDAGNGDFTTYTVPVARSDAAYLQGLEIADIPPANGQAYCWNAVTRRLEPADVGASLGDPNVFDLSYPFAGGAHDFTADANFASAAFPDGESGEECSAVLGDGADVPLFYAVHPANAGGLTRTAGGRMRLTLGGTGNSPWPGNTGTPALVYPLPRSQRMEIEFTLYLSADTLNSGNYVNASLVRNGNTSGVLEVIAEILIAASGPGAQQTIKLWSNDYSDDTVDTFVSGNTFARHYRVVLDGPNLAVYGGAVGSSVATTLLHGRSNLARGLSRNDLSLAFSVSASGVVDAPLYLEHGPLHWEGIKS